MTADATGIRWGPIVVSSVLVWLLGSMLIAGTIFAYAFSLGWAARGAPDQDAINQFANAVGPIWGPRVWILFTGLAALWLGRRGVAQPAMHGLLIAVIVFAVPFAARPRFSPATMLVLGATVMAGAIGGWLGGLLRDDTAMFERGSD